MQTVIKEMNRLGMIIDLSHSSHQTSLDALETSEAPVIFSHSSAFAMCNSTRNVQDDLLKLVVSGKKCNGGASCWGSNGSNFCVLKREVARVKWRRKRILPILSHFLRRNAFFFFVDDTQKDILERDLEPLS